MDEILDEQPMGGKLFFDKAFWPGVYLGGPLVAAYFMAQNYKALGESEKVATTWTIAIIATLAILAGAMFIPDEWNIPNRLIPILYTAAAYGIFKHYQGQRSISS